MNFNTEDTEYLFFNYFEGNLNNSEKQRMMNLIHQNPELEKEFISWAQSYSYKEEKVEDYGLADELIRKAPDLRVRKYLLSALALAIVSLIVFFTYISPYQSSGPERTIKESREIEMSEKVVEKKAEERIEVPVDKESKPLKEKEVKHPVQLPASDVKEPEVAATISETVTVTEEEHVTQEEIGAAVVDTLIEQVAENSAEDTANAIRQDQPKQAEKSESKNLKKKKRKFSLKPDPDILPLNENF